MRRRTGLPTVRFRVPLLSGDLGCLLWLWMYSDPLAYLITFHTYGTWLHGDDRGSVSRGANGYGERRLEKSESWVEQAKAAMKFPAVMLDDAARSVVDFAVRDACEFREWRLLELNVRTNHVHIVVRAATAKEQMMMALKSRATRLLRERCVLAADQPVWTDHGSTRLLFSPRAVTGACFYVRAGQGATLPMDDTWWEPYAAMAEQAP